MQIRSRGASAPELCGTTTTPRKREAERREAHPTMAAPSPLPSPCKGEGQGGGRQRALRKRARLSALHCGACQNERTFQLSPGRASREREDAGVTRAVIRA
jgi:hypothetical protein